MHFSKKSLFFVTPYIDYWTISALPGGSGNSKSFKWLNNLTQQQDVRPGPSIESKADHFQILKSLNFMREKESNLFIPTIFHTAWPHILRGCWLVSRYFAIFAFVTKIRVYNHCHLYNHRKNQWIWIVKHRRRSWHPHENISERALTTTFIRAVL